MKKTNSKDFFVPQDSKWIKKERELAKNLKKTQWWKAKLAQGLCYHCGKKFKKEELTMDHLVPLARGGRTGKNNIVTSCKKCNSQKSFKSLVELRLK